MKSVKFACAAAALVAAPLMAQNVLTNGDLSYGDGGWYIWNNPNGPPSTKASLAKWDSASTAAKASSSR